MQANNGIVAEREAAAAALTPMQFNAIRARTELASLQGHDCQRMREGLVLEVSS